MRKQSNSSLCHQFFAQGSYPKCKQLAFAGLSLSYFSLGQCSDLWIYSSPSLQRGRCFLSPSSRWGFDVFFTSSFQPLPPTLVRCAGSRGCTTLGDRTFWFHLCPCPLKLGSLCNTPRILSSSPPSSTILKVLSSTCVLSCACFSAFVSPHVRLPPSQALLSSRVWPSHAPELTPPAIRTDNQVTQEYPGLNKFGIAHHFTSQALFTNDSQFTCASDVAIASDVSFELAVQCFLHVSPRSFRFQHQRSTLNSSSLVVQLL